MRQYWTQARLKTLIVLLILAALVDSYALARSFAARNADSERIGMTGPAYAYQYTITFVIQGITAESVTHDSQECFWRTTVLGLPHTIGDPTTFPAEHSYSLTHGAFPTADHPIYGS